MKRHLFTDFLVLDEPGATSAPVFMPARADAHTSSGSAAPVAYRFVTSPRQADGKPNHDGACRALVEALGALLTRLAPHSAAASLSEHVGKVCKGSNVIFSITQGSSVVPGERGWCVELEPAHDKHGEFRALKVTVSQDETESSAAPAGASPGWDPECGSQAEFRSLMENAPDILMRFEDAAAPSGSFTCLYANKAVEAAFGQPSSFYIGRGLDDMGLPVEVTSAFRLAASRASDEAAGENPPFSLDGPNGTRYYCVRAIHEPVDKGRAASILVVVYDATDRTLVEMERDALLVREKVARTQAEAAARAKDQFLSVISHELRSPLHGIQSWTHVLEHRLASRTGQPDSTVARALAGIRTGLERQIRIVDDLLDATRLIAGKLRLSKRPFSLRAEVNAAMNAVQADAQQKKIEIVSHFPLEDDEIDGDALRIRQVVWNLLSNAVKFTPVGGLVTVSIDKDTASNMARIVVSDTGKGIAPEFLPYVFGLFKQADESDTRASDGLGLGLTLVEKLTEMHGGSVAVESDGELRGAIFTVTLPLAAAPTLKRAPDSSAYRTNALPSLEGLSVMVIDDQEEAREALSAMLEQSGADVVPASSGREAIARLAELGPLHEPDVVICDIAMPGEDGYVTLKKIREWESESGVTPARQLAAIALTAFAQREDRFRALSRGFRLHFAKPVDPLRLLGAIAALTGK